MSTNDIREFFRNEDNVWWYALFRLITSTKNETRQQLLELENELREQNRFFPKWKVIEGIDTSIISPEDAKVIKRLLYIRNQAVHMKSTDYTFTQSELKTLFSKSDEIKRKMQKIM